MRGDKTWLAFAFCALAACGGGDDDGGGGGADAGPTPDAADTPDAAPSAFGPVTDLAASFTGPCAEIALSWTLPDPAARVLVARDIGRAVAGAPEDGTAYAVGDELPGGGVVIFVGDGEDLVDTGVFHGDEAHYAVFAVNASDAYSDAALTQATVDQTIPAQDGSVSIDLVNDTITPTNPTLFAFGGTVAYDEATDTVTLDLELTNGSCRVVHNPKVSVAAINDANAVPAGDTTFAGEATLAYGPNALLDTAAASRTLTITGVDGTVDPLVVDLTVREHPSIVINSGYDEVCQLVDASGASAATDVDLQPLAFNAVDGFDSTAHEGTVSPDGQFLYAGHGQQPVVVTVDLSTLTAVASADLTGANGVAFDGTGTIGFVSSVQQSRDHRFLYAVLITGDHRAYFANPACTNCDLSGRIADVTAMAVDVDLVRLDRETLTEVDRLSLVVDANTRPKPGELVVTADGTRGAIAVRREGKIFVVDLEAMALVETVDTSARSLEPSRIALTDDAATLFVSYRGDGRGGVAHDETIESITVADGVATSIPVTTNTQATNGKPAFVELGPDGRLYYGRKNGSVGLTVFDGDGTGEVELASGAQDQRAIVFLSGGAQYVVVGTDGNLRIFDTATDAPATFEASGDAARSTNGGFGHMGLTTPF